jgi:hypothetical protein
MKRQGRYAAGGRHAPKATANSELPSVQRGIERSIRVAKGDSVKASHRKAALGAETSPAVGDDRASVQQPKRREEEHILSTFVVDARELVDGLSRK